MRKLKFVCVFLALAALFVVQDAIISRRFKISAATSEKPGTPITAQYREGNVSVFLKKTHLRLPRSFWEYLLITPLKYRRQS